MANHLSLLKSSPDGVYIITRINRTIVSVICHNKVKTMHVTKLYFFLSICNLGFTLKYCSYFVIFSYTITPCTNICIQQLLNINDKFTDFKLFFCDALLSLLYTKKLCNLQNYVFCIE